MKLPYDIYLSPFTWRYGSLEMREIWSELNKRKLWRKIWVELARAQSQMGIISKAEFSDIARHQNNIDLEKSHKIEKEIYHDVMAEIKVYASQCKIGGGKIHLGATSMDITDNAEIIQIKQALDLIKARLKALLKSFQRQIEKNQDIVCMGYTHLQPAEPTTIGYRLSLYAQDLLWDLEFLEKIEPFINGKGIKGAVGTSASYEKLLSKTKFTAFELEKQVMQSLGLKPVDVSGQTYPRKIDLLIIEVLANIASSLHKFNFDLRLMQSPNFGEWSEPLSSKRVGSSAMPFKKNPDKAEKVCSLCRHVASCLTEAWGNPAFSLLERTLDDSANRRIFIPEAFLAIDECLKTTTALVKDLVVFTDIVKLNLEKFGIFSCTESLMMAMVKKGANRQKVHELIRKTSMTAWEEITKGRKNNLIELLSRNKIVLKYINSNTINNFFKPEEHTGIAKQRTKRFLIRLKKI